MLSDDHISAVKNMVHVLALHYSSRSDNCRGCISRCDFTIRQWSSNTAAVLCTISFLIQQSANEYQIQNCWKQSAAKNTYNTPTSELEALENGNSSQCLLSKCYFFYDQRHTWNTASGWTPKYLSFKSTERFDDL